MKVLFLTKYGSRDGWDNYRVESMNGREFFRFLKEVGLKCFIKDLLRGHRKQEIVLLPKFILFE